MSHYGKCRVLGLVTVCPSAPLNIQVSDRLQLAQHKSKRGGVDEYPDIANTLQYLI